MTNLNTAQVWRKFVSGLVTVAFILQSTGLAQGVPELAAGRGILPDPGQMVGLSSVVQPPVLKGVKVYANEPFRFDFIMDRGDSKDEGRGTETGTSDVTSPSRVSVSVTRDANKLIRYFLASLTVPEKDLWVNLSPYEKDRIITDEFGLTEMGRDLLEQDYLLKQLTASVIYPEGDTGKKFWAEVYQKAYAKFGTTDIPVETFNKVWIVPQKAVVYEKSAGKGPGSAVAYVVEAKLKVMLESDYLTTSKQGAGSREQGIMPEVASQDLRVTSPAPGSMLPASQDLAKQVLREVVIPVLEKEVNEGANFIQLRQVYHSLILAAWYKRKVKGSLLSAAYVDQKKIAGVNIDDPQMSERIWAQYVEAFKKGAYNLIREEKDEFTGETIPRKYFSGGASFDMAQALSVTTDTAMLPQGIPDQGLVVRAEVASPDQAMANGRSFEFEEKVVKPILEGLQKKMAGLSGLRSNQKYLILTLEGVPGSGKSEIREYLSRPGALKGFKIITKDTRDDFITTNDPEFAPSIADELRQYKKDNQLIIIEAVDAGPVLRELEGKENGNVLRVMVDLPANQVIANLRERGESPAGVKEKIAKLKETQTHNNDHFDLTFNDLPLLPAEAPKQAVASSGGGVSSRGRMAQWEMYTSKGQSDRAMAAAQVSTGAMAVDGVMGRMSPRTVKGDYELMSPGRYAAALRIHDNLFPQDQKGALFVAAQRRVLYYGSGAGLMLPALLAAPDEVYMVDRLWQDLPNWKLKERLAFLKDWWEGHFQAIPQLSSQEFLEGKVHDYVRAKYINGFSRYDDLIGHSSDIIALMGELRSMGLRTEQVRIYPEQGVIEVEKPVAGGATNTCRYYLVAVGDLIDPGTYPDKLTRLLTEVEFDAYMQVAGQQLGHYYDKFIGQVKIKRGGYWIVDDHEWPDRYSLYTPEKKPLQAVLSRLGIKAFPAFLPERGQYGDIDVVLQNEVSAAGPDSGAVTPDLVQAGLQSGDRAMAAKDVWSSKSPQKSLEGLVQRGYMFYALPEMPQKRFMFRLAYGPTKVEPKYTSPDGLPLGSKIKGMRLEVFDVSQDRVEFIGRSHRVLVFPPGGRAYASEAPRGTVSLNNEKINDEELLTKLPDAQRPGLIKALDDARRDKLREYMMNEIPPALLVREDYQNPELLGKSPQGFKGVGRTLTAMANAVCAALGADVYVFESMNPDFFAKMEAQVVKKSTYIEDGDILLFNLNGPRWLSEIGVRWAEPLDLGGGLKAARESYAARAKRARTSLLIRGFHGFEFNSVVRDIGRSFEIWIDNMDRHVPGFLEILKSQGFLRQEYRTLLLDALGRVAARDLRQFVEYRENAKVDVVSGRINPVADDLAVRWMDAMVTGLTMTDQYRDPDTLADAIGSDLNMRSPVSDLDRAMAGVSLDMKVSSLANVVSTIKSEFGQLVNIDIAAGDHYVKSGMDENILTWLEREFVENALDAQLDADAQGPVQIKVDEDGGREIVHIINKGEINWALLRARALQFAEARRIFRARDGSIAVSERPVKTPLMPEEIAQMPQVELLWINKLMAGVKNGRHFGKNGMALHAFRHWLAKEGDRIDVRSGQGVTEFALVFRSASGSDNAMGEALVVDLIGEEYPGFTPPESEFGLFSLDWEPAQRFIQPPLKDDANILLIGGTADEVYAISRRLPQARITVVGLSREKLDQLAQGYPDKIRQGNLRLFRADASKLAEYKDKEGAAYFPDNEYDLVFGRAITEIPLPVLKGIAKQAVRVAKAGGYILHPGLFYQVYEAYGEEEQAGRIRWADTDLQRRGKTPDLFQKVPSESDKAMAADKGGIDLAQGDQALEVQNSNAGVAFQFNPGALQDIKINGLMPVILDIEPMTMSVAEFAGVKQ